MTYSLKECDWPENAGCANTEGGGGGSGGESEEESDPGYNKCEASCNVLPWPHETDCGKFWLCDGSEAILGNCSNGLLFNPQTLTCDFSCNVQCTRQNIETTIESDGLKVFFPWTKIDQRLMRQYGISAPTEQN